MWRSSILKSRIFAYKLPSNDMILHWRRISETNTLKVGKRAMTYSLISLIKFTKPFLKGTFPVENEQPPIG